MPFWEIPPYRPPNEAYSLLIRATRNCAWNRCEFCGNYRDAKFEIRTPEDVKRDIAAARAAAEELKGWADSLGCPAQISRIARANGIFWLDGGVARNAFIGDADSAIMKTHDFAEILSFLRETFPHLERVTTYARTKTILRKRPEELKLLREAGLDRLHVGLESGDDDILRSMQKGATADDMIRAGEKAKDAGFELSEYVMPGLGGRERWEQHARGTARVLSRINPHFIRLRTLSLEMVPNAPLYEKSMRSEFTLPSLAQLFTEVRTLIEELDVTSELVATDFFMNYYLSDIDGKLPADKKRMLQTLEEARETARLKEEELVRAQGKGAGS